MVVALNRRRLLFLHGLSSPFGHVNQIDAVWGHPSVTSIKDPTAGVYNYNPPPFLSPLTLEAQSLFLVASLQQHNLTNTVVRPSVRVSVRNFKRHATIKRPSRRLALFFSEVTSVRQTLSHSPSRSLFGTFCVHAQKLRINLSSGRQTQTVLLSRVAICLVPVDYACKQKLVYEYNTRIFNIFFVNSFSNEKLWQNIQFVNSLWGQQVDVN